MLIFNDDLKPTMLEDSEIPIGTELVWTLNLQANDFMFSPISFLQDHYERGRGFKVGGQYVELPESWYVVIMDQVSGNLDLIQVSDIRGRIFDAFIYSHRSVIPKAEKMVTFNNRVFRKFCFPILEKHLMLVHPIDTNSGIVVTPHNVFKKIKDLNVIDLME